MKGFGSNVCAASTLKRTKSYSSKVRNESDYVDDYYYPNSTRCSNCCSNCCLMAPSSTPSSRPSSSLSGGAIAGIVIGGVFGVLLLGLCLYYCYTQMGSMHSSIEPSP